MFIITSISRSIFIPIIHDLYLYPYLYLYLHPYLHLYLSISPHVYECIDVYVAFAAPNEECHNTSPDRHPSLSELCRLVFSFG